MEVFVKHLFQSLDIATNAGMVKLYLKRLNGGKERVHLCEEALCGLTFDMRGRQKAQLFGCPLDEVVRARRGLQLLG